MRGVRRLSRSRAAFLLAAVLCVLQCEPCRGWWGKERPSAGIIGMEGAKTKAVESWKAANETHEASVEAIAKAESMDVAAQEAEAAVKKGKGSMLNMFGTTATPEQQEGFAFAATEARALAETARQTADALARAARQARKRADKAEEVVNAAQQTLEISKKLSSANAQLVEADNMLQDAEARHTKAKALVHTTEQDAELRKQAHEKAQQALDGIQLQISGADANSSEALLAEQKTLSASGKETQGLYAVAVINFAEAEKKESAVALEVATLKTCVIEAQHALTVVELELKQTQELEEEFEAEVAQSSLESKLTQILSEKSLLEQRLFNMTSELMGLNKSFSSEKSTLEQMISKRTLELQTLNQSFSSEKSTLEQTILKRTLELQTLNQSLGLELSTLEQTISNRTLELHTLNQSLSLELRTLNKTLENLQEANRTEKYSAILSAREQELETLALSLNQTCIAHEKDKVQLTEKLEFDKQQLAEQLRAESLANETRLLKESIANETRRIEEIEILNVSYSRENELLFNTSKSVNETLKKLREHQLNESLQQEMAGLWKTANNTADAAAKALLDAGDAQEAASAALTTANAAQPSIFFRWFASAETLDTAKRLWAEADDMQRKSAAAIGTAKALQRLNADYDRIVTNLTEELAFAVGTIEILEERAHTYESFLPPAIFDPRRILSNLGENIWRFFVNTWLTSVFLVLFVGMSGVYLSKLVAAPNFVLRFMEFFGIDFHVLYGLFVAFWLGRYGWGWGWFIFCASVFVSTIGGKRIKRIKAASRMGYRLPIREFNNRSDPGFDVEIHVISGIMDKASDAFSKGDPYVSVEVGAETHKTDFKRNTLTPQWDKRLEFQNVEDSGIRVTFRVFDHEDTNTDCEIGNHTLQLYDILCVTREGESSEPIQYFIRTADQGMTKGSIMISWKWRMRSKLDIKAEVKTSNTRRQQPKNTQPLDAKSRKRYRFDPYWGVAREAEDLCAFFDNYLPGVTTKVAAIYAKLRSFNINPNGIHISLFSVIAFLCGRFGLDVGYVIPLAMALYKTESALSAVLCRVAWEKHPSKCDDVRTKALNQWQQAFIPKEEWLNESQLWGMFQSVREDFPYWLREHETAWLNNLLGMFWSNYNKWISSFIANQVGNYVQVEEVRAGSGFPRLVNSLGCIAHKENFPRVKDKMFVTIVSARGLVARRKATEMFKGDFAASCDPYVKATLQSWPEEYAKKMAKRTKTKENTLQPSWYEDFEFDLPKSGDGDTFCFEIFDDDLVSDESLAFVEILSSSIQQMLTSAKDGEIEQDFPVSNKSKSKGIILRLKWRMEVGIAHMPKLDSKRMFQLDSDLVWNTDLTVAVRFMGLLIKVKILSIRLPLRVTLEWFDYDSQMCRCPIMSTCGNDFVEFRRQWQEWADNAYWPKPVRLWLDLRALPSLETEISSSGLGDIWKLPGMSNFQTEFVCKLIYDFFPIPIPLGDPAPVSEHSKPSYASTQFVEFMDGSKNGGLGRSAILKIRVLCAETDATTPLDQCNYYCVVRYGRLLRLDAPLDKEILLNENYEQLRFSNTQWMTKDPKFADNFVFDVEAPGDDMVAFEVYRIDPNERKETKKERKADTLVLKHKYRMTDFIDKFGVIVYPRVGNDSNKKSLRRLIHIKDDLKPGPVKLSVIAQLLTRGSDATSSAEAQKQDPPGEAAKEEPKLAQRAKADSSFEGKRGARMGENEDTVGSELIESFVGMVLGAAEGERGCPGTLLVQLSAPSKQSKEQQKAFSSSRNFKMTLRKDENVIERAVFEETPDDSLKVTRSTMGPVFHFEIANSCCKYELEVSDGNQSVKIALKKMKLERDGYFEIFPKDLRPSKNPSDEVPFPAIMASFLPHVPTQMPTVCLTVHRVEGLPWYSGPAPLDAFCRVTVRRERKPAPAEEIVKNIAAPLKYQTYEEYVRAKESLLPVYDGGSDQEKTGFKTARSRKEKRLTETKIAETEMTETKTLELGKLDCYFGDEFSLGFGQDMLHSDHAFQQIVYVEVFQVDESQGECIVGTWHKPIRDIYVDYFEKLTKDISDAEMAAKGSIVGSTGVHAFSLTRDQAPWTSIELEFEFQGNWMSVTEAHQKWWVKQEQAARIERAKLELEAYVTMAAESAQEAIAWRTLLQEKKDKEANERR